MAAAKEARTIDGTTHWRCGRCGAWQPAGAFYKCKRSPNGLKSQCRTCHTEGSLRTRNKERARRSNRAHMLRARARDPEKFRARERLRPPRDNQKSRARYTLNNAVRGGRIARPSTCSRCGLKGRIEGHHRDYSKPLDVEWLCVACHGLEHRTTGEASHG